MTTPNIKPLSDRVLVKPLQESETTKGGIIIPDSAKQKSQEAQVLAVGTGGYDSNNNKIDFTVKVGDIVLLANYCGSEFEVDGEKYIIVKEAELLGIVIQQQ